MTRRSTIAGVVTVCSLLTSQVLHAECDLPVRQPLKVKGAICGTAVDVRRDPLADTDVELLDRHDLVAATSHTDAKGAFRFPRLPAGAYGFRTAGFRRPIGTVRVSGSQSGCKVPLTVEFAAGAECDYGVLLEGMLEVSANVMPARLSINGRAPDTLDFEDGPERFYLEAGVYHLVLEGPPGYATLKSRVRIKPGQTTKYRAEFRRRGP